MGQVGDRASEYENKLEELHHKSKERGKKCLKYKRNVQELWDTILRKTDLWFIDRDEDQWHKLGRQQDHGRNSPKSRNVICIIDTKSTLNIKQNQKNFPWCVMIKNIRYTEQ